MASIQLSLGHRFVQLPDPLPFDGNGDSPLENVVPMSGQYRWLAVQAAETHTLEPGVHDPAQGYPVEPFTDYLDDLLTGLVDPGIEYTVELFRLNHVLREGQWIQGNGHVFRLLADGDVLTQEALVGGQGFEVEILVSAQVLT